MPNTSVGLSCLTNKCNINSFVCLDLAAAAAAVVMAARSVAQSYEHTCHCNVIIHHQCTG